MRIAVNTRLLISNKMDGIGWFTCETLRRMVLAHPEHEFYFFFDRKPSEEFLFVENVKPVVLCPQARHPVLWYLFFEWATPYALKRNKIDVYLSTDGMMPVQPKVPTLTVIHDLNFEHADGNLKRSHQRYMKYYFPRFARAATRIRSPLTGLMWCTMVRTTTIALTARRKRRRCASALRTGSRMSYSSAPYSKERIWPTCCWLSIC